MKKPYQYIALLLVGVLLVSPVVLAAEESNSDLSTIPTGEVSFLTPTEIPTEAPTNTPTPVASPTEAPTNTPIPTATVVPPEVPSATPTLTEAPTATITIAPSEPPLTNKVTKVPTPTPYVSVIPPAPEGNYNVKETDVSATVGGIPTVTIDGVEDALWTFCNEYFLENPVLGTCDGKASFRAMWDSGYLYLWIVVEDSTADVSNELFTRKDCIEIFFNESGGKGAAYEKGDQHYLIARNGEVKFGNGAGEDLISFVTKETENGYVAEVALAFVLQEGEKDASVGLDIRINDSHGKGSRDSILQWSDTSLMTYTDLSKIGTITFR